MARMLEMSQELFPFLIQLSTSFSRLERVLDTLGFLSVQRAWRKAWCRWGARWFKISSWRGSFLMGPARERMHPSVREPLTTPMA